MNDVAEDKSEQRNYGVEKNTIVDATHYPMKDKEEGMSQMGNNEEISKETVSELAKMTESEQDRCPPKTARYDNAWGIINSYGGVENVRTEYCISTYISKIGRNKKKETMDKYRGELFKIDKILKDGGFDPLPWNITEEAYTYVMGIAGKDGRKGHYEISTKKWFTHIFDRYLRFFGNTIIQDMVIRWPQDMRPNVSWLSDDQYAKLKKVEKTPLEAMVIELELGMGFRSVEVCRMMLCDVHQNSRHKYMDVRGKGIGDGKWRSVPFNYDTEKTLSTWLEERKKIVARVRSYDPSWVDPGNLLLWTHYISKPDAGAFSEKGGSIERGPIRTVISKVGFKFEQHTLRRTYGRRLYHSGVSIEAICKLLGHEDIKTTLQYIGVNMDDMEDAMRKMKEYDDRHT